MLALKILLIVIFTLILFSESHPEDDGWSKAQSRNARKKAKASAAVEQEQRESETEQLSKELISKLHIPAIKNRLRDICQDMVSKRAYAPNQGYDQWVVAVALDIKKERGGQLTLTYNIDQAHQVYSNHDFDSEAREDMCNQGCVNNLNRLKTRIRIDKKLDEEQDNVIHTEIQMMYRSDRYNLMSKGTNKDKVILVYSLYIPCSQNQFSNGGVFAECAGEMNAFRAIKAKNRNNNYFIVFYETAHEDGDTVKPVSKLYMELGGIPSFLYNSVANTITQDPLVLQYQKNYFVENPVSLWFPRPLKDANYKFSKTQLFVDCLAGNLFLMHKIADTAKNKYNAIKDYIYAKFGTEMGGDTDLGKMLGRLQKSRKGSHDHIIVQSCHKFTVAFSTDEHKQAVISDTKTNNYYNYDGYAHNELDGINKRTTSYQKMLEKLNRYFG